VSSNKELVRQGYDAVNTRQIDLLKDLFTSDFNCHFLPGMSQIGLEPQKRDLEILFTAFPDYHVTIDDSVSQGDKIAVRLTVSGTHNGDFYASLARIPAGFIAVG
jgi:predicted ester cyclase